jgi:unsaturated rhamnogalacturonyl hydrolase
MRFLLSHPHYTLALLTMAAGLPSFFACAGPTGAGGVVGDGSGNDGSVATSSSSGGNAASSGSGSSGSSGGGTTSSSGGGSSGGGSGGGSSGGSGGGGSSGSVNPEAGTDAGPACASPAAGVTTDWGKVFSDGVIAQGFGTFAGNSYPVGLFMHGLSKVYKRTKDPAYLTFMTNWANGNSAVPDGSNVDDIMHMTAVADVYELTSNSALVSSLTATRKIFDTYPKTTDGAFIHNTSDVGQNWGDTSFMSLSFLTRYGQVLNDSSTYGIGTTQVGLFSKHLTNPATGLLFHAYDETRAAGWVVPGTNHSAESWGRAMGWFVMATVMVLEAIPANDPGRPATEKILADLVGKLAPYQDPATGRWWQVVDKGATAGNWLETSCSAMYSYGTFWAVTHGLVDPSLCAVATKGFNGVLAEVSSDPTKLITGVCEGTGVGNYAYYTGRNHTQYDDFHGLGSFLLMWEGMSAGE